MLTLMEPPMLFSRKAAPSPEKVLRLVKTQEWRQGESLRITTQRPRTQANPAARRLVVKRQGMGELALSPMRWGLRFAAEGSTLNARPLTSLHTQSIQTNAEWRRLLNAQRCVIPAEQFFEWKRVGDVRTREYCMKLKSGKPMMIAGLWNRTDFFGDTFAYVSCQANPLAALIHEHMPAILDPSAISAWFNPDTSLEMLLSFLKPVKVDDIIIHAVDKAQPTQRPNQPSLFDRQAA